MKARQKPIRESVKLGTVVSFKTGKLDSNAATPNGKYPFFTCSQETFRTDTYSFDTECVLLAGNNANGIYPLKFFSGKFDAYQRTYVIRSKDANRLNNRFLYYALRLKLDHLRSISTGAATKFLTLTILNDIDLELPLTEDQQGIVSILSAYDDLIENNTRRIETLEETARRIYEEWFVRFRFPGHGNVKMVESELGLIPDGWDIKKVSDVVELKSGYAFRTGEFTESGEYGLVTIKNVQDGAFVQACSNRIGELPPRMPAYCHLSDGDILLSLTGNVGRVCIVYGNNNVLNQRVAKLAPTKPHHKGFSYCLFRSSDFRTRLENLANGVAQQNLSPVQTGDLLLIVPDDDVLEQFESAVGSMLDSIVSINLRNANLRRTRDLLLPKLISGEIDVSTFPEPVSE